MRGSQDFTSRVRVGGDHSRSRAEAKGHELFGSLGGRSHGG